jgi:hypothetical protein
VSSRSTTSYGEAFNLGGGGVFAMLWEGDGIWFCELRGFGCMEG